MNQVNLFSIERLNILLSFLKNRKIFLTGGTGFLGKNLTKSFIYFNTVMNMNIKITILSRDIIKFQDNNPELIDNDLIEFISGDIRNFDFPSVYYDYIIHAAAPTGAQLEINNSEETKSIIVDGTKRIVRFANECGAQKLLLTSSGAVYGVQPHDLKNIPESYESLPYTAYGRGKFESEKICAEGFKNVVIARCFSFVGPYIPIDYYAIGNFIRDGLMGNPIVIQGDGRPLRSYLYSTELVDWLLTILSRGVSGRAYNVGSEDEISIKDLAYAVSECFDIKVPVKIMGEPDVSIPAPRYVPSTLRAREELGLSQKFSLKESLRETINWYKKQRIET